jgi:hypothetical protein
LRKSVAGRLGLDDYFAEVLPHQKVEKVREVKTRGLTVAMIGDGVNDAPTLVESNLGIAIGAGTDVAIESAEWCWYAATRGMCSPFWLSRVRPMRHGPDNGKLCVFGHLKSRACRTASAPREVASLVCSFGAQFQPRGKAAPAAPAELKPPITCLSSTLYAALTRNVAARRRALYEGCGALRGHWSV